MTFRVVGFMGLTRYLTYSPNEAEAWNFVIPTSQTIRETRFLIWTFRKFAKILVHRVVDMGCGTGRIALELTREGYDVTGVDKHSSMVRVAKRNARRAGLSIRFSRGSLQAPGLKGSYDAVCSIQDPFNYLLSGRSLTQALSRIHNLIRPGGVLVVEVMNFASLYGRFKKHYDTSTKGKGWALQSST